jgi:hypothetical protein
MSKQLLYMRLQRAVERLQFLLKLPRLTTEEVTNLLTPWIDPENLAILLAYRETTNQCRTAERFGMKQRTVWGRLHRTADRLERLSKKHPRLQEVAKHISMLVENHNILYYCAQLNVNARKRSG